METKKEIDTDALLKDKSVKFCRTYSHAWNLAEASLGVNDGCDNISLWSDFRNAIINEAAFNELWKDENFKTAMHFVNDLVDAAITVNYNFDPRPGHGKEEERENKNLASDLAERCISECALGDDGDLKAVDHLLSVLSVLENRSTYHALNPNNLHELKMIFITIAQCQQMVLHAFQEEEKEKRKPLKKAA